MQNRLNGFALLAIEHEIADQVNLKEIREKFVKIKVEKKVFYIFGLVDNTVI